MIPKIDEETALENLRTQAQFFSPKSLAFSKKLLETAYKVKIDDSGLKLANRRKFSMVKPVLTNFSSKEISPDVRKAMSPTVQTQADTYFEEKIKEILNKSDSSEPDMLDGIKTQVRLPISKVGFMSNKYDHGVKREIKKFM